MTANRAPGWLSISFTMSSRIADIRGAPSTSVIAESAERSTTKYTFAPSCARCPGSDSDAEPVTGRAAASSTRSIATVVADQRRNTRGPLTAAHRSVTARSAISVPAMTARNTGGSTGSNVIAVPPSVPHPTVPTAPARRPGR
jgi:hypothetical protein